MLLAICCAGHCFEISDEYFHFHWLARLLLRYLNVYFKSRRQLSPTASGAITAEEGTMSETRQLSYLRELSEIASEIHVSCEGSPL